MANPEQSDGYSTRQMALHLQILRECEEMAQFAFGMGRAVPGRTVEVVETALIARSDAEAAGGAYRPDAAEVRRLSTAHQELSRLVAPARPNCLVLMDEEARAAGMLHFLGPVGLVRRLMGAAILCLATFIGLALFQGVGPDFDATVAGTGGVLSGSGLKLLGNMLFYIASAGLGASFGLLYEVNGYIVERTFDPKYESSYWIKLVLGMIAGFILVTLVPIDAGTASFALPTIAMLGGFSASAVYRILNRLVQAVESMVRGDAKEMLSARENAARARAEEQEAQTRMKMAAGLLQLQQQLSSGVNNEDAKRRLNEILASVMPSYASPADEEPLPSRNGGSGSGANGAGGSTGSGAGASGGDDSAALAAAAAAAAAAATTTVNVGADTPIVAPPEEEPAPEPVAVGADEPAGEVGEGDVPTGEAPPDESGAAG
jgi:uncharacterized membrane protein YgcG